MGLDEAVFEMSGLNPTLARALLTRLFAGGSLKEDMEHELARMEGELGAPVYAELIYLLSHLRFDPEEAKRHWTAILSLRDDMARSLGSHVELRIALLRYFTHVHPKLMNPKIIELRAFEETRASAYTDDLTGLRNHRYLAETLPQEVLRSERSGAPVSLLMADVDAFKRYNDRHGHEAGNTALAAVAHALKESVRVIDVVARYGGEEFVVILPSTPKDGARLVAERVRLAVEGCDIPGGSAEPESRLTVSVGIATCPADGREAAELVRHADEALYEAKAQGRNRVRIYGGSLRSFPRALAHAAGRGRLLGHQEIEFWIRDIGEDGMFFRTGVEIGIDQLIDMQFRLPGSERLLRALSRVLRVARLESGEYEAAARFVELRAEDRLYLSRLVRSLGAHPADSESSGA